MRARYSYMYICTYSPMINILRLAGDRFDLTNPWKKTKNVRNRAPTWANECFIGPNCVDVPHDEPIPQSKVSVYFWKFSSTAVSTNSAPIFLWITSALQQAADVASGASLALIHKAAAAAAHYLHFNKCWYCWYLYKETTRRVLCVFTLHHCYPVRLHRKLLSRQTTSRKSYTYMLMLNLKIEQQWL